MSGILNKISKNVKLIEGSDEVRAQKCLQAVKEICQQYDCMLVPTVAIQGNEMIGFQMHGDIGIVPIPRKPVPPKDEKK